MKSDSSEFDALELLSRLVAIDSVNPVYGGPGEASVAEFVSDWLGRRGIAHEKQAVAPGRVNIIARIGAATAPALLLEAHMDTVGVEGWAEGSAHDLVQRGNRFFGRGACDTKASLACFMLTLERFAGAPETLKGALVFAATVDEENEQLGAYELAKTLKELGVAKAITGEPTRSDVIARHKGVGRYLISTAGKAAHSSVPGMGRNAVYAAARIVQRLEEHAGELERLGPPSEIERGTLSVGIIRGGIGFNVVPDACEIEVDRRFGSGESTAVARSDLERICASESAAKLAVLLERPALRGEGSAGFVREMLSAGEASGHAVSEREVPYMTNAVAYEAEGIPSLVFGPGDIAQAHKNDEFIEAGQMGQSLRILHRLLKRS